MKTTILITGATAVGKTGIALDVAKYLPKAEILSVDSRQIYRHMNIGTAKVNQEQRERFPHHFLDMLDPDQKYSAGEYARAARNRIHKIWDQGGVPLLVGGTGLYWQSVYDGFFIEDEDTDRADVRNNLQQRLKDEGIGPLYKELGDIDPIAQNRIEAGDIQRIMRCLEIVLKNGRPLGELWRTEGSTTLGCHSLMVNLTMDRAKLYGRINARVDLMLEQGLVQEVESLLEMGYGHAAYAMGTMGYQEIEAYIAGRISIESAISLIKHRTRNFAKRQLTWCRRDRRLWELNFEDWGKQGVIQRIVNGWQYRQGGDGYVDMV